MLVVLVYDPFLLDLPPSGELVVSDGELLVEASARIPFTSVGFRIRAREGLWPTSPLVL